MAEILRSGGVEVHWVEGPFELGERRLPGNAFVLRADQSFRPFLMEMLDSPAYPMLREGGVDGEVIRPYDVTSWRLPDLLHVRVLPIEDREDLQGWELSEVEEVQWPAATITGAPFVLPCSDNRSFAVVQKLLAAGVDVRRLTESVDGAQRGDFVVFEAGDPVLELARSKGAHRARALGEDPGPAARKLRRPRLLIFSPWGGSMDEGWTRLVLERHGFAFERLRPGDLDPGDSNAARKLRGRADVILLPSIRRETLENGAQSAGQSRLHDALWPEEYRMGLGGAEVGALLRAFVQQGGSLVCLDQSVAWAIEHLGLPVRSALTDLPRDRFYAAGTLLRAEFETVDPLAWGMPARAAVYFARGTGFKPIAWPQETAVSAVYDVKDVWVAGFLVGEEYVEGLPAVVDIPVGEGHVVLFGFSPQRRAQTEATYKLLFNAIVRAGMGS
jgi:hypothetical protein